MFLERDPSAEYQYQGVSAPRSQKLRRIPDPKDGLLSVMLTYSNCLHVINQSIAAAVF